MFGQERSNASSMGRGRGKRNRLAGGVGSPVTYAPSTDHSIQATSRKSNFPVFEYVFMSAPNAHKFRSTEEGSHLLRQARGTSPFRFVVA